MNSCGLYSADHTNMSVTCPSMRFTAMLTRVRARTRQSQPVVTCFSVHQPPPAPRASRARTLKMRWIKHIIKYLVNGSTCYTKVGYIKSPHRFSNYSPSHSSLWYNSDHTNSLTCDACIQLLIPSDIDTMRVLCFLFVTQLHTRNASVVFSWKILGCICVCPHTFCWLWWS